MLYDKTVILAKIESTFGTDSVPDETDAIEAIDPQFGTDFTKLERKVVAGTKSPQAPGIGRKQATLQFQVEVKGSGETATEGKLGRLLKSCDMTAVQRTLADALVFEHPSPFDGAVGRFTMVQDAAYAGVSVRRVILTCTIGGGSGVASFTVKAPACGGAAAVNLVTAVMTDATEYTLVQGATITPTITKDFVIGDKFVIYLSPAGWAYYPRTESDSEAGHSLTLCVYYDGILHKLTGCRGNWSMNASAGEFGTFTFNFTGNYVDAEDEPLPENLEFETTLPPQVEKSQLWFPKAADGLQDQAICSAQFTFTMGNTIAGRRCVNDANGFAGAKVTARKPQFTADPEMVLEADHGFWSLFETGAIWDVMALIAEFDAEDEHVPGNGVAFIAPHAQTDAQPYANRDNTRAINLTANLSRIYADDEMAVILL